MANFFIFLPLLICQVTLSEAVPVEPMCSKFSYDEQLLEKMVRMEFFVENVQKDSEKRVSNVMDIIHDIQGNNSVLSYRLSEQQEKVDSLERQTDILNDTTANKDVVSENTESIRSIATVVKNIRNNLKNNTSGLDNLKAVTAEINKKCEDGLSDLSKNLERQTNVLSVTMANKSIVSENTKSINSMAADVRNIINDLEESTSGLDNLKVVTDEVNKKCEDGLSDLSKNLERQTNDLKSSSTELSKRLAALEKQMKELDQATKEKTQTVAFNVMDAVNYTGSDVMKFSRIILNKGGAYNIDTGIFTAPIDGIYQFNAHICGDQAIDEIDYYIAVNSLSIVSGEFTVPAKASDAKCASFSVVALVRKGENVQLGGVPFSYLDENNNSNDLCSFSGVLIQSI